MSKPDLKARVVNETVDPGTHRVLLRFDDGTFEATRWPASRFRLPGYRGRIRAQLALERLKRTFGKSGLLTKIRNEYAFHFPPDDEIEVSLQELPDADKWASFPSNINVNSYSAMDAKGKRRVITDMLDKLKGDMLAAVEKMPEDWDETELAWYLVHRAELFTRSADRLRHKAYEHALRSRRL
jgi:hypothetical protein